MTDNKLADYMHREMTGKEFCELFPNLSKKLVKLTNEEENHNRFQFVTGLNIDNIKFDPSGECNPGGIYFTDIDNVSKWINYMKGLKYCRKVTLPSDCRVYIAKDKFKANEIILGERVEIKDLLCWSDNDFCMNAVKQNVDSLDYVRNINHNIQLEAIKNHHSAIKCLLEKKIDLSKEIQMEAIKWNQLAVMYLLDYQIDIPKEVQIEAVKHNALAIGLLLHYKVNVSDEVRLAAELNVKQKDDE